MTKITNFEIKKLHGYKNLKIKFKDNKLILVGENGSGKTSVLRIFYYFLTCNPFLTFPNALLTVINTLWHGFCWVATLPFFNIWRLTLARFLLWRTLTSVTKVWHGFCYACAPVKLFHVEHCHTDTQNKMFHVEHNTKS